MNKTRYNEIVVIPIFVDRSIRNINAGMDGHRIATIVFFNSLADVIGIRYKTIHPLSCLIIPKSNLVDHVWHKGSFKRRGTSKVIVVHVPYISDGTMAETNVKGVRTSEHALAAAHAGTYHEVKFGKVKSLPSLWHKGKKILVMSFTTRPALDIRGSHITVLQPRGCLVFVIHKRIDGSIWPNLMHALKDALSATLTNKPVMNKGDFSRHFQKSPYLSMSSSTRSSPC